eukprot:3535550-Rhodomonas_salina.1
MHGTNGAVALLVASIRRQFTRYWPAPARSPSLGSGAARSCPLPPTHPLRYPPTPSPLPAYGPPTACP